MVAKKYKNGLVLGKMNVFHLGHKYLIDSALDQCETVHVMVCSLKSETTKGIDRFLMVANTYKNNDNVHIIHCDDENPQHPEECNSLDEFYNDYWVPTVMKHVDELDCVFTSEEYGDEFSQYLGIEHVLVDMDRKTFPVSGTAVRDNIRKNWKLLPEATQKFFKKKICIVGPESTGKSTMVDMLAFHYYSPYVAEYGRTYTNSIQTSMLNEWDFDVIAANHYRLVEKAWNENKEMFLFVDTEAIVTKTFRQMYLKQPLQDFKLNYYIGNQDYDLYLLLTPEVKHYSEPGRDFAEDEQRWKHFNLIKAQLDMQKFKYEIIDGDDYTKRFEKAKKFIDKFIKV